MNAWLERLDRALDCGAWLVLPVVTLLFLQWPLRDLVHGYSREANDLGQWLFALYVAMAVTVATRAHTHLAADLIARGYSPRLRVTVARAGALIGIVPWALFVLYAGSRTIANSVAGFEDFNIHSRACEIDRGCEAGDTRADDNDVRSHCADLDAGFCASGVTTSEADAGSKSEFFRHERDFPSTQV